MREHRLTSISLLPPQDGVHVYPLDDDKRHVMTRDCWCRPELDRQQMIWVHRSADGREDYETGKRKPH